MRKIWLWSAAIALFMLASKAQAQKKQTSSIYHKGWIDFNKNGKMDVYEDPSSPIDERVEDLLSQMTLEEKSMQLVTLYGYGRVLKDSLPTPRWKNEVWKDGIANIDEMLNGVEGAAKCLELTYPYHIHVDALHQVQKFFVEETRLGIPAEFTNEGIHGLNHPKATPLPAPISLGSTWNRELIHRAGTIAGTEARLLGYHAVYAPILDLARDPRWGRTLECYSEDPFLISELGVQMVKGIQEQGVASALKHYAAYSVPKGGRDGDARTDPHITPRELHEIFLYPFKKVIQLGKPMEIMSSYNDWNGEPVTGSHYFLTELLRNTYGFNGYVVSDSEAVEYLFSKHKVAATYEEAAKRVLEAGMNVRTNFTPPHTFAIPVRNAVSSGMLSMATVDQRVREVLKVKFRLGLFDNPYTGDGSLADAQAGCEKQIPFIEEVQNITNKWMCFRAFEKIKDIFIGW
ncbi:MAG: glycoside hydrolase family 3 protein [Bacteroidaceae bacterium]|nr:glycoside hydrolase family 3 protein [Bacteroidaceae bacterium]